MPKPPPRLSETTGEGAAWASRAASSKALRLRVADRGRAQVLRTAEDVETFELESALADLRERLRHLLGVDAELLGTAAHLHPRQLELEVRVDAHGDTGGSALALREGGKQPDLAERFDVEQDAGCEPLRELGLALSGACKADIAGIHAGVERHAKLAARCDVETVDESRHVIHQRRQGIGLHRIMKVDPCGQHLAELRDALVERAAVVHVERRAPDALCKTGERHPSDHELAALGRKLRHRCMRRHAHAPQSAFKGSSFEGISRPRLSQAPSPRSAVEPSRA